MSALRLTVGCVAGLFLVVAPCPVVLAGDLDGDGVDDSVDACCNTPLGVPVDAEGRPVGDLDRDCDADLDDFALFQASFTGPSECTAEVCDGQDNDCDCVIDNMGVLTCGIGPCYREVEACLGGVPQTCVPGNPDPESCSDGVDNDCDGFADCADAASCPIGSSCGAAHRVCHASGLCDCAVGYADCDASPGNGCEVNTDTDLSNCGSCNSPCNLAHATENCAAGACVIASCDSLWGNCNGQVPDGCETALTSLTNCGACNLSCVLPHATETCSTGQCRVSACDAGWCNQNGSQPDGCEYSLDTNPACGSYTHIGNISGDTGAGYLSYNATGERWFRIYVSENDNSAFLCQYLSATLTLTPPATTDYDLYVYCDNCTTVADYSNLGGSAMEQVDVRWDEYCPGGFPSGDSGRYVYIEVRYYSANICDNYQLQVYGHTNVSTPTCSDK